MNGIIVIDKPQGMTSHDVVSFLRQKTGVKRIGHTGTLDPMATGVLPVFIGKATRLIEYANKPGDPEAKLYRCTMKLGIETDTQDIWGTPLTQSGSEYMPEISEIKRVLKSFEGAGVQKPPMYSAVKVGGRKLYEYARKGAAVDEGLIKARDIYIKEIYVNGIDISMGEVCFDVLCSKGVYIRTLCADAGRLLGCGAVMSGLVRLKSESFLIESAISFETIQKCEALSLLPVDIAIEWLPRVELGDEDARAFAQGRKVSLPEQGQDLGIIRVYNCEELLGIGITRENAWIKPEKVICEQ